MATIQAEYRGKKHSILYLTILYFLFIIHTKMKLTIIAVILGLTASTVVAAPSVGVRQNDVPDCVDAADSKGPYLHGKFPTDPNSEFEVVKESTNTSPRFQRG